MTQAISSGAHTALVTGSSGGLGTELSKRIASDGYEIILTARREDNLDRLAGELANRFAVTTSVIPKDLADPEAPGELFKEIRDAGIHVNTLVNTAGFVQVRAIDVPTIFEEFDDYWKPFLGAQGPSPAYVARLSDASRRKLRERLRSSLPVNEDGSISLQARAWAVQGTVRSPP